MKYLVLLIFFVGCGKPVVPEKVEVKHSVEIQGVEPYIRAYCKTLFTDNDQIEQCVQEEIGKMISKVGG